MKLQMMTLLPLFTATALAIPAAQPAGNPPKDPVEVCTKDTIGDPCLVASVLGARLAGRCIFDFVSRPSFPTFPLWFTIEKTVLTSLDSCSPMEQSASSSSL